MYDSIKSYNVYVIIMVWTLQSYQRNGKRMIAWKSCFSSRATGPQSIRIELAKRRCDNICKGFNANVQMGALRRKLNRV